MSDPINSTILPAPQILRQYHAFARGCPLSKRSCIWRSTSSRLCRKIVGGVLCRFFRAFATSSPVARISDRPKTLFSSSEMGVVAKMAAYEAATYSLVLQVQILENFPTGNLYELGIALYSTYQMFTTWCSLSPLKTIRFLCTSTPSIL